MQDLLLPSYIQSYSASSTSVTISAPLGLSMVLVQSHPPQPALRSSAQLWPLALARLPLEDSYASDHVFLFSSLWLVLSQHAPLIPPRGPRSSSPSPHPSLPSPLPSSTADCIISNRVISVVPEADKHLVFEESHRILKPGGRLTVSDILARKPCPPELESNLSLYAGCGGC